MSTLAKPWLQNYDTDVPHEISIPEITLVDLLAEAVNRFGDAVCTIYEGETLPRN